MIINSLQRIYYHNLWSVRYRIVRKSAPKLVRKKITTSLFITAMIKIS